MSISEYPTEARYKDIDVSYHGNTLQPCDVFLLFDPSRPSQPSLWTYAVNMEEAVGGFCPSGKRTWSKVSPKPVAALQSGMGSSLFVMQQYGVDAVWDGQFPLCNAAVRGGGSLGWAVPSL